MRKLGWPVWAAAIGGPVLLLGGLGWWWRSRTAPTRADVREAVGEIKPVLRRGATGSEVEAVQELLGATVDGIYGPNTEARVKEFQRQADLVADGVVGPATWAALLAKSTPGLVMGDAERRRSYEA